MFTITKCQDFWKANVDFSHKDTVKRLGFKWSPQLKVWYTTEKVLADIIESGSLVIGGFNVILRHNQRAKVSWFAIYSEGLEGSTPEDKGDNYWKIRGAGFLYDPKSMVWHARHVSALKSLSNSTAEGGKFLAEHASHIMNMQAELSGLYETIVDSRDGADGSDLTEVYQQIDELKRRLKAYGVKSY